MFRKGDYIGKSKKEKNTFICCIVIIGVIIIPLLYSWLYLGAFWDPYAKLDELPVAVINLDKGVEINGKSRNLGNDMCDKLKEDGTLKFIFVYETLCKRCNFKAFRLCCVPALCIFPCFCPYEPKQGKVFNLRRLPYPAVLRKYASLPL